MQTGKTISRAVISFLMLTLVVTSAALGQTATEKPSKSGAELKELKREVQALKQEQEAIRKELRELKELLPARKPTRPTTVDIAGRPFRGSDNARVVIIEFSDFQCPYCGEFFREAMPQLEREYIKTGKIKYVFNNLPLEELHSLAFKASQAAECAGEQGKFWELHDWMFANQKTLGQPYLESEAKTLGLDLSQFKQCLAGDKSAAVVRANADEAQSLGIDGTPSFIVGLADDKNPSGGNIRILGMLSGAQPFSVFKAGIERAMAVKQ